MLMFKRQFLCWSRRRAFWHTAQFRHISTRDHKYLGPKILACVRMTTMTVADDVRDVGALSDDALDERRGLPAIAALRAAGRVFICPVLHVANAV